MDSGFPSEVAAVLKDSPTFHDIELLLALPGGSRSSQNDIWALARTGEGLVSIAIEGKVEEPFGPALAEWLTDSSAGKSARLAYLQDQLALPGALPTELRYQLLHRTASAVVEARRFSASRAIMLVHSFSPTNNWFADYSAFAALLGIKAQLNSLQSAGQRSGVDLHLAWVSGNAEYLSR